VKFIKAADGTRTFDARLVSSIYIFMDRIELDMVSQLAGDT
jgi:hypothetical protein